MIKSIFTHYCYYYCYCLLTINIPYKYTLNYIRLVHKIMTNNSSYMPIKLHISINKASLLAVNRKKKEKELNYLR
ncbi:hypothetical protein E2C01_001690 [Portunus trituberculatus]|uniref:Uncharacterized protein n=1 Tax=Portunus trituberculatus TaxID=210409 RepID=A0A5B7CHU2_PORTR|nr:hypothetical protein [Portunus trituberculatus]